MLNALENALSFLTLIPTRKKERGAEEVSSSLFLFPLIGALVGAISGFFGMLFFRIFSLDAAMALSFFFLLFIQGFNHLDGLLDFSDAAFKRGTKEERIKVMHDTNTGSAAFGIGFFVMLLSFLFIREALPKFSFNLPALLALTEANSKLSMVFLAYFSSSPSHQGAGSAFIEEAKRNKFHLVFSTVFFLVLSLLLKVYYVHYLLVLSVLSALFFSFIASRLFGGVSGDVFGACNETTRLLSLIIISAVSTL